MTPAAPGAVHGVLERRFAGPAAALDDARQHVRRHARHLDAPGRPSAGDWPTPSGTCRASRRTAACRNPGRPRGRQCPSCRTRMTNQNANASRNMPEEHGHRVVDQHAGEDLLPRRRRPMARRRRPSGRCVPEARSSRRRPARSRTDRSAGRQRNTRTSSSTTIVAQSTSSGRNERQARRRACRSIRSSTSDCSVTAYPMIELTDHSRAQSSRRNADIAEARAAI